VVTAVGPGGGGVLVGRYDGAVHYNNLRPTPVQTEVLWTEQEDVRELDGDDYGMQRRQQPQDQKAAIGRVWK